MTLGTQRTILFYMRILNAPRSAEVNDRDIHDLRARAEARGDSQTVKFCDFAMDQDYRGAFGMRCWCAQAIRDGK